MLSTKNPKILFPTFPIEQILKNAQQMGNKMNRKDCILKWLSYFLIVVFFLSACNSTEPSTAEMIPAEPTATSLPEPTIAPTTELRQVLWQPGRVWGECVG
jgi:hypothetical protein